MSSCFPADVAESCLIRQRFKLVGFGATSGNRAEVELDLRSVHLCQGRFVHGRSDLCTIPDRFGLGRVIVKLDLGLLRSPSCGIHAAARLES